MNTFNIPIEKKPRVIINTDAKNEVDDQFAIVHTLLTESFDLKGLIAAHFGTAKSPHTRQDSRDEIDLLLKMMALENKVRVENGADYALADEKTPVDSAGARLIIEEAMKDDNRPLYIAFLGPLTDMASALLLEPAIAEKNITVIWIGGGKYPEGGAEYNLSNDIMAANVIMKSKLELWQVPKNVYRMMPVSYSEMMTRIYPCGELGRYLTLNVIDYNNARPGAPCEYRVLGDSPAIGLIMYDDAGEWEMKPAPEIGNNMKYIHTGKHRPIKVYKNIDSRFIMEDFYAKLSAFTKKED